MLRLDGNSQVPPPWAESSMLYDLDQGGSGELRGFLMVYDIY